VGNRDRRPLLTLCGGASLLLNTGWLGVLGWTDAGGHLNQALVQRTSVDAVPFQLNNITGGGWSPEHRMLNGTSPLSYNLYMSAAYSNVWGDGSGSTTLINGGALLSVGTTVTDCTVYGRIPAGQDSAAGSFLDTIVVTLNY
jgi:spore coat protein U-like protein